MNPYRMPRPKKDVLFQASFFPSTEEGRFNRDGWGRMRVRLAPGYLWLRDELSVPLSTIQSVDLFAEDKAVSINFHHRLEGRNEILNLCALHWIGIANEARNRALVQAVRTAIEKLPSVDPLFQDPTGCEVCGDARSKMLHLGVFRCVGIWPIIGAYNWKPMRWFLCKRHAIRTCALNNLETSLVGYLGFPGVFVAPFRVWKNLSELKAAFEVQTAVAALTIVLGIALPLAAIATAVALNPHWLLGR